MSALTPYGVSPLIWTTLLFFLIFNQFLSVDTLSRSDLSLNWIKHNCPSNATLTSNLVGESAGDGSRTFGSAFNSFISQVKNWRITYLRVAPLCNIFAQWVRWVKTLFNEVHCDSGNGKWCTADRDSRGHLITDDDLSKCTPHHCKWRGGKKCKFHSRDKDPRNNDGKWKRGTCRSKVPCLITCLRVHSNKWRSPEEYAGKIQEAWGRYINAASKRGEEEVYEEQQNVSENVDDEETSVVSSFKTQRWIKSLVDRMSKRRKRSSIDKRFDWSCDSKDSCSSCSEEQTGSYCKEWDDGSTNCCVCINFR